ncbi:MAG: prolyl oligopeptidase family serine peptidase [Chitinophagales bacterium]
MKNLITGIVSFYIPLLTCFSQNVMTPELLWSLGRVSPEAISADGKNMIFGVTYYQIADNKGERNLYTIPVIGGEVKQITSTPGSESNVLKMPSGKMGYVYKGQLYECEWDGSSTVQITNIEGGISHVRFSPDGQYILYSQDVKTRKTNAEIYPDLPKANARIIDDLMYRHWDSWEDELNSHIFYAPFTKNSVGTAKDIMEGEQFDSPVMPFGGLEDVIWGSDSKSIMYVCKKKSGRDYAVSTNTDIYLYDMEKEKTINLTEGMMGFDTHPVLSPDGKKLAWLSMERDGYEADKNRLFVMDMQTLEKKYITETFDETINTIQWSNDGNKIYFTSPTNSTIQIYVCDVAGNGFISKVTSGQFDITGLIGEIDGGKMLVTRADMNHAAEIYSVVLSNGEMMQVTKTNDSTYNSLALSTIEQAWVPTFDAMKMLVNVILPPNFDKNKKYPVLVYCQGGPQSTLSQYYSFRWNFQLMAAQGYVVIAPCRRGMPGFGTVWNELISGDWGGRAIKDYLSATDWAKKLPYVDTEKFAAVGASYGGYAVYMLAGVHEKRFQSFIAHDGIFNTESFYGTTEEIWFSDFDMGGAYWEKKQNSSYTTFNPMSYVRNWDTPILIFQGGKDYRTTEDQAFQAFTAAKMLSLKSRFVYLPDENHWVLTCQNALLWQREFYNWLGETLK